jgi:hypothetical protein
MLTPSVFGHSPCLSTDLVQEEGTGSTMMVTCRFDSVQPFHQDAEKGKVLVSPSLHNRSNWPVSESLWSA